MCVCVYCVTVRQKCRVSCGAEEVSEGESIAELACVTHCLPAHKQVRALSCVYYSVCLLKHSGVLSTSFTTCPLLSASPNPPTPRWSRFGNWQVDLLKGLIVPLGSSPLLFCLPGPHLSGCHRARSGDLVRGIPPALALESV